MRVFPLDPANPNAFRHVLIRHGFDPVRADAVVHGTTPSAVFFDDVPAAAVDGIALAARELTVECLTGERWAMVLGSVSRLAGLARPGHSRLDQAVADALGHALRFYPEPREFWRVAGRTLPLDRPLVAGILNVTPDSFSDGGEFLPPDRAVAHSEAMVEAGADLLDVGAESTRPGRDRIVPEDEEWGRLAPVLAALAGRAEVPVSVDTYKPAVARRALGAGASVINDVSGLRFGDEIARLCATAGAGLIVMHSRGDALGLASDQHAEFDDVVFEVREELAASVARATGAGIEREAVVIDPGLGFGKRPGHNLEILNRIGDFASLGLPIMVGPSRKRFLRGLTPPDADLDQATGHVCAAAYLRGASLFRVHDVASTRMAVDLAHAIRSA